MILVTGADGFIGRQVCHLLAAQGYNIVALDRGFGTNQPYPQVSGDVGNPYFLSKVFQNSSFDTIIHLAAILNSASRQQPDEAMRVNIGGSMTLLQLAAQYNVSKFIYGSSISVYGSKPFAEYGEVAEDHPAAPNTVYGASKLYVELVGQEYRRQEKLQFQALRIGMVVGPGALNTSSPWRSQIFELLEAQQRVRLNLPFASGQRLPLIGVAEVAEAFHQLILSERPEYSIYNLPTENWQASALAGYLCTLNPNIEVTYSPRPERGDPEAIDSQRFLAEFSFQPVSLRERFQQVVTGKI